jgi:hypothetical protein
MKISNTLVAIFLWFMAFFVPWKTFEFVLTFELTDHIPELPYIIVAVSILFVALGSISLVMGSNLRCRKKEEKKKEGRKKEEKVERKTLLNDDKEIEEIVDELEELFKNNDKK